MADVKTSAESAAAALDGTELIRGVQAGGNVKITGTQVKTLCVGAGAVSVASGKTLTGNNSITLAGTDGKSLTLTNGLTVSTNDGTLAFSAASKTLTVSDNATVSGTNTGDQTIALTGDVTGSGTGSFAATIAASAVTTAKINAGAVTEAKITLADNTTGNVSTSAHGFAPKSPNDATKYLDGSGGYSVPAGSLSVLRSYIAGCALSNNGTTSLNVAAGQVADDTNAFMLSVSAGTIDCTTTGANGLDTGSLANSTWYHVFAISKAAGANPALLASTSVSSPSMPATYTLKRRIGSFLTDGSAHILAFTQVGDTFYWGAVITDVSNSGTDYSAGVLITLSVPLGVVTRPIFRTWAVPNNSFNFSSPSESNVATPTTGATNPGVDGNGVNYLGIYQVNGMLYTNTSSQIRIRTQTTSGLSLYIYTRGYIDDRGRYN
jgi:hypothetical protein